MFRLWIISLLGFGLLFLFAPSETEAQTCTPPSLTPPNNTCDVSSDVTVSATVPDTTVTFSGYAPGGSVVYFQENGLIVGSVVTSSNGTFSKAVVSNPGSHIFVVYLTDSAGRSTPPVTLPAVTLSMHTDVPISNLHLPPTISISKTSVAQSEIVTLAGQASPGSSIDIYVNGTKRFTTVVGNNSQWQFDLNGGNLADDNTFYAISTRSGLPNSEKSQEVSLKILACSGEQCDRTSSPNIAQVPDETPSATDSSTNVTYKIDLGEKLSSWFPWIIIFSGIFLLLLLLILILLIFLLRRRRKNKKDVLTELEGKVQQDLNSPNPPAAIKQDFYEAEEKIDG